jgi:hypothetical protein
VTGRAHPEQDALRGQSCDTQAKQSHWSSSSGQHAEMSLAGFKSVCLPGHRPDVADSWPQDGLPSIPRNSPAASQQELLASGVCKPLL